MSTNNILFALIGLILLTTVGIGGYVVNRNYFSGSATSISETGSPDILNEQISGEGLIETDIENSLESQSQNSATQQTITECVTVRIDDDDDEFEDDDDDVKTKEVCTTRIVEEPVPVSQDKVVTQPATPVVQTTPPVTPTPIIASYTMAQVQSHTSASSCWSVINGSVYDLTSFVSRHSGGSSAIKSLCGVDGTTAYNGQHGSSKRPANELASLKIGILK